ncbi:hypothetical protein NEOLEDRAFT_1076493 [Neolentinus lepideus HHB14362 ss-1]|uniref:Uncharacterized protein n=1 Tax=Neolentinus lepideus HHB14362 ss-1 TaxID=1314782 RepID=A0A165NSP3_9AGAM|nr:hypothetical protein NEOLEDRAFT_1076493 [Neolentinus lepideus HHB14362 ss-1]
MLLDDFMCKQNEAFAWNDNECGCFKKEFFPPIDFPVLLHTPWIQRNILILPGIYPKVCAVIKCKIAAGVYEPSNASYSLEPLNAVTIQHSGVILIPDHMAEQFAKCACSAMLDLYMGYDK